MLRPIVLSNGEMHVGLNNFGLVHDFYYPYVGLTNHAEGDHTRHRIGVWCDGKISWLDNEGEWEFTFRYPIRALVGHTIAKNASMNILLEIDSVVDSHVSAFIRNIHVVNMADYDREIRLFTHQAFVIDDSRSKTDTAQYLPDSNAIVHYRGRRAFIVSGVYDDQPFDQHSIGLFGIEGHESVYRDAEDGELDGGDVEHGRVDSVLRFKMNVGAHSSERVHYWITAGSSIREALYVDKIIRDDGVHKRIHGTVEWWHKWLQPAVKSAEKIDPRYHDTFLRSVMILKSHIDKRGAVIASTDSSMLNYGRDAYAYCWPRDAAFVLWPMLRMGYTDEVRRYLEFCRRVLHPSGYLMHKYRADGGLGASWHSYTHRGGYNAPPVQEDETAITIFLLNEAYKTTGDIHLLNDFYDSMVKPMANWMAEWIDETTGLPKPSYDLWEEHFLISTYTVACTYAGMNAAAELAEQKNDNESAVAWRAVADDIKHAAQKYLYNHDRKSFYKGLNVIDGTIEYDSTIDTSSVFGVHIFGLFDVNSEELKNSIHSMREVFGGYDVEAFPRYENDNYRRANPNTQGNWWFIPTLWMAQYCLEIGDDKTGFSILEWVKNASMRTGVLSEQINPDDHSMIAPAPLGWSHAEYVSTLLDTMGKSSDEDVE